MKMLLINPKFPESFWSFTWTLGLLPGKSATSSPLGLATLAALCPSNWEVEIVDENIEPVPDDTDAEIVGVCGMGTQFRRQTELLTHYRAKGHYVVAGSSYASLVPDRYTAFADTVIAGECEYIWSQFCRDFEAGHPQAFYEEKGSVDLKDSPVPRYDLLKIDRYDSIGIQATRGCPFRCEFCDIIVMFGRRPRAKSPQQIVAELDTLRSLGACRIFFVDDNFIGDKRAAEGLLNAIIAYQREHDYPFRILTEVSINVAREGKLLTLMREANFDSVFIGIESPDPESLKETKKYQNVKDDLLESVRTVYRHGIDVFAGFIVGFDNDTVEIFDRQYDFIVNSGIQLAMIALLTPFPRTPLYDRLRAQGRLIERPTGDLHANDAVGGGTNFVPLRMTYEELVTGYRNLYGRLVTDEAIAARIRNKLQYLTQPTLQAYPTFARQYPFPARIRLLARFVRRALLPGGRSRFYHFARSMPWRSRKLLPLAFTDWMHGMSVRDYYERNLEHGRADAVADLPQRSPESLRATA